ncbi:MAG: hypothetical protein ACTHJ3_19220 [Pararhizobium sp.]
MRIRLLLSLSVFLLASGAAAHDSPGGMAYDPMCCNGDGEHGDCAPIPSRDVSIGKSGYHIALSPGDHPGVHVPHVFTEPFQSARTSTDGRYHACLYPTENQLRCFYAPPQGS